MGKPTATELSKQIGREGLVNLAGLQVGVRIVDARSVFDRVDLKIVPLSGRGETWIIKSRFDGNGGADA